jgi:uncharacterized SAM-binding protein YcdF (DUF218 family)
VGIGAAPPRRPPRRTSWSARLTLLLLATVAGLLAWLYVWPPAGQPLDEGPVVVLGGGAGERLLTAVDLLGEPSPQRPLVLSEGASSEWERRGRSCRENEVRCFDPQPGNTFGEARTFAGLAQDRDWRSVTVITSDYHATRTRMYFAACVEADVRVVAADSGWSVGARVAGLPYELLGTLAGVGNLRHC